MPHLRQEDTSSRLCEQYCLSRQQSDELEYTTNRPNDDGKHPSARKPRDSQNPQPAFSDSCSHCTVSLETGRMPVLRYHLNSCNRRATSSAFARLLNALMRKYPSPFEPKPLPGVITTFASPRILSNAPQLVTPCG